MSRCKHKWVATGYGHCPRVSYSWCRQCGGLRAIWSVHGGDTYTYHYPKNRELADAQATRELETQETEDRATVSQEGSL